MYGFKEDAENRGKKSVFKKKGEIFEEQMENDILKEQKKTEVNILYVHTIIYSVERSLLNLRLLLAFFRFCFARPHSQKCKDFNHFIAITLQNMCVFTSVYFIYHTYQKPTHISAPAHAHTRSSSRFA